MQFTLTRVWVGKEGCFGTLAHNNRPPFALTLERTFDPDNRVVVPSGVSQCTRDYYNKGGYVTYEIQFPDGSHDRVLFHKGNKEQHSAGCILVAEQYHTFEDIEGISNSKHGFEEFMELANGVDQFELKVV